MPYDPTSARGALRGTPKEGPVYIAPQVDVTRGATNHVGKVVGPGSVPVRMATSAMQRHPDDNAFVRNETRLDLNKRLPEFAPESQALHARPRPGYGWGARLFGYAFAWICAIGFLGVLSITIAYCLDRYYNELFTK